MGWNGSDCDGRKLETARDKGKPAGTPRCLWVMVGVLAVTFGGTVAWWSSNGDQLQTSTNSPHDDQISNKARLNGKKRTPTEATNRPARATSKLFPEKPVLSTENPIVDQKASGRVLVWRHLRGGPPVFTNRFESLVCEIMLAQPGERFLDLDLDDDFDETFHQSLNHRITIEKGDSEEVRMMKQMVIDAKEEMRKLAAEGRSASDVVTDARDELNKVADYRDNVQTAYNDYLLTIKDPKDAIAFAQKANKLLEEYGALPIDAPVSDSPEALEEAYEQIIDANQNKLDEIAEEEKKLELEK